MYRKILSIVAFSFIVAILISSITINATSDANNAASEANKSLGGKIGLRITVKDSRTNNKVLSGCIVLAYKLPGGPLYLLSQTYINGVCHYCREGLPQADYYVTAVKASYFPNSITVKCPVEATYNKDILLRHR